MQDNLYRERALFKFRRYYFHALRNQAAAGKINPDEAATEAMWKARKETLELLMADPQFESDLDREEAWADALIDIMFFRQLLMGYGNALDPTKLPPKVALGTELPSEGSSGSKIATMMDSAVEQKIEQHDNTIDSSTGKQ